MKLYDYYRSSASYRVRIAIHYKKLECEFEHVNLVKSAQNDMEYSSKNPQQLVPLLEDGQIKLNQSLAILEYLEDKYPSPALLPANIEDRMAVKALALEIACEIHPLNNLRVLKFLNSELGVSEEEKLNWYHHWLRIGFESFDKKVSTIHGDFCFGDSPTWADLLLVPQMYNAYRFEFPMDDFPLLTKIYNHCLKQEYFIKASPEERVKDIEIEA